MASAPSGHNGGPILIDVHPDDRMEWVRWHHRDYLQGIRGLRPADVGIYSIILNLLYDSMGMLKDDDRFIASHCQCDVRTYSRIRDKLIEVGKIWVADGHIYNNRAMAEIARFCAERRNKREAATKREAAAKIAREMAAAGTASRTVCASLAQPAHTTCASRAQDARKTCNENSEKTNEINGGMTTAVPQAGHTQVTHVPEQRTEEYRIPPNPPPVHGPGVGVGGLTEITDALGHPVIQHRSFAIDVEAVAMQLVTANLGVSTTEARQLALDLSRASARQWAAEIDSGRDRSSVVPRNIPAAIRATISNARLQGEIYRNRVRPPGQRGSRDLDGERRLAEVVDALGAPRAAPISARRPP